MFLREFSMLPCVRRCSMIGYGFFDQDYCKSVIPSVPANEQETAAKDQEEYPFYIIPAPPVPGRTSWSMVPW
jgi:hypothetical protein